jgi:hypothetical protein
MNSFWSLIRGKLRQRSEMEAIFQSIYESNAWGSHESPSGPGSTKDRGMDFIDDLLGVLQELRCRILLDVPCGDFNWIGPIAQAMDEYIGADIVPQLVSRNRNLHGSTRIRFVKLDLAADRLPDADAILCRDGLVHLSFQDIGRCLENIQRSRVTYLVTTTFAEHADNEDIRTGSWRTLNIERPPFSFPKPLRTIDESCHHTGGIYADKRLAFWRVADLIPKR